MQQLHSFSDIDKSECRIRIAPGDSDGIAGRLPGRQLDRERQRIMAYSFAF